MSESRGSVSSWPQPLPGKSVESKLDQILELLKNRSEAKEEALQILTKEETCALLKGTPRHMRYLLHEKKCLPYFKVKGEVRIRKSDLMAYIEKEMKNSPQRNPG